MDLFKQYKGLRKENYILFFGSIVTNMGSMIWPMITMILDKKLGMSAGNIALLLTAVTIICLPANLIGGRLADRLNKKHIIVFGDIVSVICFIICGIIPLSYKSIALIVFASIFQSIEGPAYQALVADITPTSKREKAFSLLYLGSNLGLMVSPTISGLLFNNYLWLAFIISGTAIGCSTLLIILFVKDITPVIEDSDNYSYQKARTGASSISVLRENKAVLLFVLVFALYFAAYNQFSFLMPLEMGRIHGENGAVIYGTVTSLNCFIVVIFTPLITGWFKKTRETGKMLIGIALLITGYIIFVSLLGFIPAYYAAIVIFTWGEIFNTLAEGPYISNRVPSSHRGRINSITGVFQQLTIALFNVAIGKIYDIFGSPGAWSLVFAAAFISLALSIVLTKIDRITYPKLYY